MGRLECYSASSLAWEVLRGLASAFVTIEDEDALEAARILLDAGVPTTPSGAAGLAGLMQIAGDSNARATLDLQADSRVVFVVTETDLAAETGAQGAVYAAGRVAR
jgi:diaminopropionate ammonia-lyase